MTETKTTEAPETNYLIEQAAETSRRQTREDLGRYLQGMTAKEITECLEDSPLAGTQVTPEFLAGFLLAAELVRDQGFDY